MYEGPVIYESKVQDYFWIIFILCIVLVITFLMLLSLSKIFKKADEKAWKGWIPFYHLMVLLKVVALPSYYFILFFIPIINLYPMARLAKELARSFRKSRKFALSLFFFPLITYPILGFNEDRYVGMNEEKVQSIVLEDIPEIEEGPVIEEDSNLINQSMIQEESSSGSNFIHTNDSMVKSEEQNSVSSPSLVTPTTTAPKNILAYKECPECRSKVREDATTCFICGHKF